MSGLTNEWQRPSLFLSGGCLVVTSLVSLGVAYLQMKDIKTFSGVSDIYDIGYRLYGVAAAAFLLTLCEFHVYFYEGKKHRITNAVMAVLTIIFTLNALRDENALETLAHNIDNENHLGLHCCRYKDIKSGACVVSRLSPACYDIVLKLLKLNCFKGKFTMLLILASTFIALVCEVHMLMKYHKKEKPSAILYE
ncbi:hypothetical protein EIN_134470 [Entamoeba invadens IP1]|uniref:Uncharacterized protein n=1 Tax=Entamoeba invadens IP1 TaxID=370355 RepID=A0A0A1TXA1_ENTIV|nr:hypothetical protein EIN_134470 [Entamoeba invadens IP1]ELP85903.1 hypothetical protein EIN_134470 [Entamoeba invadens IP1]|eukprot:XP_004185249.1 hypothetical protein EIN_134470 [Entamoeba invadens IP1]